MDNPVQEKISNEEDRTRPLLELLYHVSRELATALDLRTVLQRVLFASIQNVGGERGSIVVLDDAGKATDSTIVYGQHIQENTTQQLRDTVERGLAGWVLRNRRPAIISDTNLDERWLQLPRGTGSLAPGKSAMCVPILAREKLVGVLTLVHSEAKAFGNEHLALMQAIADQAGVAIVNARLYTESQRQARVMGALVESATAINTSLRLDDVLHRILNQAIQALQVETVAIALEEPSTKELVFRAASGYNAGLILNRRIPPEKGLAGQVMKDGRGVVVPDVSTDEHFNHEDRFGDIDMRSVAFSPIQSQGKVIGVLEAINPVTSVFDTDALLVLNGLGGLAGSAIQNAQLFERLDSAHKRYRELFDESIDPIILTNWEGIIVEMNRVASNFIGYDKDALRMVRIGQLHDVNLEKTGEEFSLLKDYQTCSYESVLHCKDNRTLPVQVQVRPVEFDETEVLQWTMHDISERKALDDLRNDLIAMVYHDLRSPLANIISSLGILSGLVDTKSNETVHSLFTIASNSTTRIERLVNSLLDINRLESGLDIANQQVVDLSVLAKEASEELKPALESRKQILKIEIPKNFPQVWFDKDMLLRVLINLLENATKFTPSDGKITLSAQVDGKWGTIAIKDTGPGIPPNEQARVFDKFTRLQGARKTGGLGIGLAFCRMAVEGHGGRIWIKSTNGNGTTFFFTLPIATKEQKENEKGSSVK